MFYGLCPHDKTATLQCGEEYETDEYYRQLDEAMKNNTLACQYIAGEADFKCHCNPVICPKYMAHMQKRVAQR